MCLSCWLFYCSIFKSFVLKNANRVAAAPWTEATPGLKFTDFSFTEHIFTHFHTFSHISGTCLSTVACNYMKQYKICWDSTTWEVWAETLRVVSILTKAPAACIWHVGGCFRARLAWEVIFRHKPRPPPEPRTMSQCKKIAYSLVCQFKNLIYMTIIRLDTYIFMWFN